MQTLADKLRALTGSVDEAANIFFPGDLVGGFCPRAPGDEARLVWTAATEACGSERVVVAWRSVGDCIWYLAAKAEDLASHANSWCPLAALLPSEKDKAALPVCYTHYGTYFGEDIAILMVVKPSDLRIYRSTPVIIRAKAERTARELGESTKIIDIDFARIEQMTPVPWRSMSLFEDRARRILSVFSVFVSLAVAAVAFVVWLYAQVDILSLTRAKDRAAARSTGIVAQAEDLRISPMRRELKNFLDVNEGVLSLDGYLSVYEIKDGAPRWRASVPSGTDAAKLAAFHGHIIEVGDAALLIGNEAELEASRKEP